MFGFVGTEPAFKDYHSLGWADFEFLSWILMLIYLWPQVTDRKGIGYFSKSPEEDGCCHKDPLEGENH